MKRTLYLLVFYLGLAAAPLPGAAPVPGVPDVPDVGSPANSGLPEPRTEGLPPPGQVALPKAAAASDEAPRHARLGVQKLAYQSLIHRDRDRPGAVAEWRPAQGTDVRGFVFHPKMHEISGNAVQESDLEHQLLGVVAAHAVPVGGSGKLKLTGGWVAGNEVAERSDTGAEALSRSAWSLGADASLLDTRLRVSIERAGSERIEGRAGSMVDRRAAARRFGAEWRPSASGGTQWHAGAEYSWVGPEFDSAANTDVKTDRERLLAEGGLEIDEWQIHLSASRERDDVIGDRSGAAEQKERYRLRTTWTPPEIGSGWWRGRPRVRMHAESGRNERLRVAESGLAAAAYRRLQLESDFSTDAGRWGVRASRGQTPGAIDAGREAGLDTAQLELYRDQRGLRAFPVRAQLEWRQRTDRWTGTTQERWEARLGSRTLVLHDRVDADFDLRYRHQGRSGAGVGETDLQLGGRIAWTLDHPTANRGGLALTLDAEFADRSAVSGSEDDDYRVLLTLSGNNPLADW
ncbi:hypothetical protein [Thioalkalivibrio sp.]|uniref:hypothetical protein n=1 Tax=Thioalkalivibrio sp. TaxID=2093813 RepID=UPI0035673AFA